MNADERINDLLRRAGSPMMIVRGGHRVPLERHEAAMADVNNMAERMMERDPFRTKEEATIQVLKHRLLRSLMYEREAVNTVERLAAALENALNERDAAIKDIPRACGYCKHWFSPPRIEKTEHGTVLIACENEKCYHISGVNTGWEWRGVPDKEE